MTHDPRDPVALQRAQQRRTAAWVGHGDDAVGWEEDLCLEVDRWLTTGEYGPTMRVLWWLGISPEKLRRALTERLEEGGG